MPKREPRGYHDTTVAELMAALATYPPNAVLSTTENGGGGGQIDVWRVVPMSAGEGHDHIGCIWDGWNAPQGLNWFYGVKP